MNNSKELTLKRSLRAKKIITCITSGLCAGVLMSMTAFAAGTVIHPTSFPRHVQL